jgi:hypothetical protein
MIVALSSLDRMMDPSGNQQQQQQQQQSEPSGATPVTDEERQVLIRKL